MARRIMESFNPRSSRVLKNGSRKSKQLQSFVRTKTIQDMLAEQTTLHVGQQVRITQLIRSLERTNATRKSESHTDRTTNREPGTSSPRRAPSPRDKITPTPGKPGKCEQPNRNRFPDDDLEKEHLVTPKSEPVVKSSRHAQSPAQCTQPSKDDSLDNNVGRNVTKDRTKPHKKDLMINNISKDRSEKTMTFKIRASTWGIPRNHDIEDRELAGLRQVLAFYLGCEKTNQVSICRPVADEILYGITVSAQDNEDVVREHRAWTATLTSRTNLGALRSRLKKWGILLSEIQLRNGTGWIWSRDYDDDGERWYMGDDGKRRDFDGMLI